MNEHDNAQATDYRDRLLERLLGHYLTNTTVPGSQGGLTPDRLHRLCRAVLAEGYGDRRAPSTATREP